MAIFLAWPGGPGRHSEVHAWKASSSTGY